jgi:hypothetical protein
LPSKKFIVFALIILLLGAGAFWFYNGGKLGGGGKITFEKQGSLMPFQQNSANSDWEQVLERTSVYSEVNKNLLSNQTASADTQPVNETDKFSQNFLSQFFTAFQTTGGNIDDTTKQNLIDSLEKSIDTNIPPPVYKISDIKISSDDKESIMKYGSQLSAVLSKYTDPPPSEEVYIFEDMVQKKDKSLTDELVKSVLTYEGLTKDSLALAVPPEIKIQHLKLINTFVRLKGITEKFQNYFNDPLGGAVAIKQYTVVAQDLIDSVTGIRNYLKSKNVNFKF